MAKDLIIVCDDSFGLDVKTIIQFINKRNIEREGNICYHIKGFVGTNDISQNVRDMLNPFLGYIQERKPENDEYYAMGIVDPQRKKTAVELLKNRGAEFVTLRAPWVLTPLEKEFDEGCIIAAQSIKAHAKIGKFVTLYESMIAGVVIEDYVSVMAYANTTDAHIGTLTQIDPNSIILEHRTIGDRAHILANSVVVKDVKPGQTVSGIPARRVREPK